jgi:hypothetical protein
MKHLGKAASLTISLLNSKKNRQLINVLGGSAGQGKSSDGSFTNCLAVCSNEQSFKELERETGFEPATSTLARLHSTAELFPPLLNHIDQVLKCQPVFCKLQARFS